MKLTKEELAARLNGREYREEMTTAEEVEAKESGLVVVFGASDDLIEFRGAICDEDGAGSEGSTLLSQAGLLGDHDDNCSCAWCGWLAAAKACAEIYCIWNTDNYSWQYNTTIPHATFDILEDTGPGKPPEKYCRGIVFELASLPKL